MMSGSIRHVYAFLFFLLIFFLTSIRLGHCTRYNGIITCPEIEKQALLSFKKFAKIPSSSNNNMLHNWNEHEVDCCTWKGVVCNNLTGHVHQLHLHNSFGDSPPASLGILLPSLLILKNLRYLDLSFNSFRGTIPASIGSFAKLEYLDLSSNEFHGIVPHTIGNISSLHTLRITRTGKTYMERFPTERLFRFCGSSSVDYSYSNLSLRVDSLEWLSGLSHLEHLDMSSVDLSSANDNWLQVINTLPSLLELRFCNCSLNFIAPLNDVNVSSLTILDLSQNEFKSAVPRWIFQLNKITHLDLSDNSFEGLIPRVSNITKLQHIDLSRNRFNSTVPDWIYVNKPLESFDMCGNALHGTISNAIENLTSLIYLDLSKNKLFGEIPNEIAKMCKMKTLDLSFNKLQGNISYAFGNMSDCFLEVLENLDLGYNQLGGHLTDNFGEFRHIVSLNLQHNMFTGPTLTIIGKLLSLELLFLQANKFSGNLPECFGQLFNLVYLYIEDNMLEGVVTETHFANLTKLSEFRASRNRLRLEVHQNWIPAFKLKILELGSWDLGAKTQSPKWLDTQKNHIEVLNLSNSGISFEVPSWFWKIIILDLSHNQLSGKIPELSGNGFVRISSNKFSGSLPRVAITIEELDLSNNSFSGDIFHFLCNMTNETSGLRSLRLEGNRLSGELPDCWSKLPELSFLNLGNNNISGSIPNSIGLLTKLQSLNLYNNNLSGQIPPSIQNCTYLLKIDLANNNFVGNIQTWNMTSLSELIFLILRSNKLNGEIPSTICNLNSLQILDLSNNKLYGQIPKCFDNFTAMTTNKQWINDQNGGLYYLSFDEAYFLESASISTKGSVLEYDTILLFVTSIDLSRNNLSGEVPEQLTRLVELRYLNLSMNHLTGTIPYNIGEMKQLESLDLSRNSFSGEIPNTLGVLTFLSYLDISFNDLKGRIPESTQLQRQNASAFMGNKLCGPPLTIKCHNDGETPGFGYHEENNRSIWSKVDWLYVLLSSGYATRFSIVCSALILKKSWRDAYFGTLEDVWNKIYVYTSVKVRKRID